MTSLVWGKRMTPFVSHSSPLSRLGGSSSISHGAVRKRRGGTIVLRGGLLAQGPPQPQEQEWPGLHTSCLSDTTSGPASLCTLMPGHAVLLLSLFVGETKSQRGDVTGPGRQWKQDLNPV